MDMSKQRLQRIRDLEAENKALKASAEEAATAMRKMAEETAAARKEVETLNKALTATKALRSKRDPGEPETLLGDAPAGKRF